MTTAFGNRSLGRDTFDAAGGGFVWRGPGYDDGWTPATPEELRAVRDEIDAWLGAAARQAAPRIDPEPGEEQPANLGYGRCVWCRRVYTLRGDPRQVPRHRWAGIRSAPTCPGSHKPPVPRPSQEAQ